MFYKLLKISVYTKKIKMRIDPSNRVQKIKRLLGLILLKLYFAFKFQQKVINTLLFPMLISLLINRIDNESNYSMKSSKFNSDLINQNYKTMNDRKDKLSNLCCKRT